MALEYLKKAADAGSADGMYRVAGMYACGYGVEVCGDKAMNLYEKAVASGSYKAMLLLAQTFINKFMRNDINIPDEVEKVTGINFVGNATIDRENNPDKALEWFEKAVKRVEELGDDLTRAKVYRSIYKDIYYYDSNMRDEKLKSLANECRTRADNLLLGLR